MIVGIVVSLAGLCVSCVGMKCTTCGAADRRRKARIATTGGVVLLFGAAIFIAWGGSLLDVLGGAMLAASCPRRGKHVTKYPSAVAAAAAAAATRQQQGVRLCSIVACSWFAHNVIRAFYNPYTPINTKFEFGAAIFIAWGGSLLDVLGGAMLAASCPRRGKHVTKYPSAVAAAAAAAATVRSGPPSVSNKEYV
ncbi:hypothetical protein CRUP_010359 [Coryphaenoides rupestris]|nr:hypothetical protein CRUP_010359 [Coryphaenoides rupestris]